MKAAHYSVSVMPNGDWYVDWVGVDGQPTRVTSGGALSVESGEDSARLWIGLREAERAEARERARPAKTFKVSA